MSTTRIKTSAWPHKNGIPEVPKPAVVIETHPLTRDLSGNIHTPNGILSGANYEAVRVSNPHLLLPTLAEIPYKTTLLTH